MVHWEESSFQLSPTEDRGNLAPLSTGIVTLTGVTQDGARFFAPTVVTVAFEDAFRVQG